MRMGSTIVVALFGDQKFNWASIIKELLFWQVSALGGKKGICLSSYLYHLYRIEPTVTVEEREEIDIFEEIILYGFAKPATKGTPEQIEDEEDVDIMEEEEPAPTPKRLRKAVPIPARHIDSQIN